MADDLRISELAVLAGVDAAATDLLVAVDVSDTSMGASGTDKQLTLAGLATALESIGALASDVDVAAAIAALSSVYQPLDFDLSAIANLITTAFGRSLLTLASVAGLGTGSASSSTFLRGDGTWAAAGGSGGGDVLAANNLSDLANAATARTNLGLGTAATSAASAFQPVDSDLTAIAALSTTTFGRSVLALADAAALRTLAGLGTIATQASSAVTITGGSISGINDLALADGGTGASDAATARTNLGLGTIATQAASAVTITGGSISGITDLALADGGTGASTAAAARANLGIDESGIANGDTLTWNAAGSKYVATTVLTATAYAQTLLDDADAATARTTLGLGTIATQAASAVAITGGTIAGITDLAVADGGTGSSTTSGARVNLGLAIGTDVQAYDAELAAIAGLVSAADRVAYFTGSGTASLATFTSAARTLVAAIDAAAQRTALGLGTASLLAATEVFGQAQTFNAQTGTTYTLVAGDVGKCVSLSNASSITLTLPQDSDATVAVGTCVDLYQLGAGQVTVAAGTGATLRVSGLTAKARAQYSRLSVQKVSANTWSLMGDLAAS